MKISKIFILATTIVLLIIFTTSCIPDTQDLPTPSNTFDVNISVNSGIYFEDTIKTIIIDGDSVTFELINNEDFTSGLGLILTVSVNSPNYEYLRVKTYPYNYLTHTLDSTFDRSNIDAISANILINDSYIINNWDTLTFVSAEFAAMFGVEKFSNKFVTLPWLALHNNIIGTPWISYMMPENTDQYIVLRKHINTQYQYYWIRTRNETIYSTDSMTYTRTIKIFDGKYQMDSITTGQ